MHDEHETQNTSADASPEPAAAEAAPKETPQAQAAATEEFARERAQFATLLLTNPNYFGNLPDSPYQPVQFIVGNTFYERLTCVGFNPSLNTLEATIQIRRPTGYGSDLCHAGSFEHVRFFLDYGSGWIPTNVVSFNVHDIPNSLDCADQPDKPLSYVVTLPIEPRQDFCGRPVLPLVRAILSWNLVPPPNPNWLPPWGNRLDHHIQIKPRQWNFVDLVDVLGAGIKQKLQLPEEFEEVKFNPIPLPDPPPLALADLVKHYQLPAGPQAAEGAVLTSVEPHRFGLGHLQLALGAEPLDQQVIAAKIAEWQALGLDWQAVIGALLKTSGDVSYEQLDCLGLDYNNEWLVATLHIKKPIGYGGDLCHKGSLEHIAFWADWDDTCEWTYLGTPSVEVHDIAAIPADGLHYAVVLPVYLDPHRRPCDKPKIARVRAVLSWSTLPSTTDPDAIPHWGNRLDAHVQIRPGQPSTGLDPAITIIGGISTAQIDTIGNGMTTPNAVFALYGGFADPYSPARACPFGGRVHIQAFAPAIFSALGYKYRILTRKFGTLTEIPVTTSFLVADGVNPPVWRTPDPSGFIPYINPAQNVFNMLGWWDTAGNDMWEVRLEMVNAANVFLGSTPWYKIQLDNTAPDASIHIDSGGDCKDFNVGVTISGHFVARDDHFGHFELDTLPDSELPPDPSTATPNNSQTALAPGDTWTLNTSGMTPCGYVIELRVWDRTIVGSIPGSHNFNKDDVGFCLREAM